MFIEPEFGQFIDLLKNPPTAHAIVNGSPSLPNLHGLVLFYQLTDGVLMIARIEGLPQGPDACSANVFGFHIHEGNSCSGNATDPFADAGTHYNPANCRHPAHAGDLPPLFGNHGFAFMAFMTDKFSVSEVVGRTVIVHSAPDDFTTQPSGNSGAKIACGQIMQNVR